MTSKLNYLLNALRKAGRAKYAVCPSCGSTDSVVVDRKLLITTLRRCGQCRLLYRVPITTSEENAILYQKAYSQGFTTEMPDKDQLEKLRTEGFKSSDKDFGAILDLMQALTGRPPSEDQIVYDYGCSWGYGSFQIRSAGYTVVSHDVSVPRLAFGKEHLNLNAVSPEEMQDDSVDVFFSSHVVEHVPSVAEMFELASRVVRPGGLILTLTPNGTDVYRSTNFDSWHSLWGNVHPQLLDDCFADSMSDGRPYLITSTPADLDAVRGWNRKSSLKLDLTNPEFVYAVIQQEV